MSDEFPEELTRLYSYFKRLNRRFIKLKHSVFFHRPILSFIGFGLIFVLVIPLIVAGIYLITRNNTQYIFLTGPAGSTTSYIAPRIKAILNMPDSLEKLVHFNIVPDFNLRPSCGGLDTNAQINTGVAHLGFAEDGFFGDSASFINCSATSKQIHTNNNGDKTATKVRVLLSLYKSPLHIVVRKKLEITDLQEIPSGLKAYLGSDGSSTNFISQLIVNHFDLKINREGDTLDFEQAAQKLINGEFDAAFFLTGLHTDILKDLLQHDSEFQLLPIANTASLRTLFPYLESLMIPPAIYPNVQSEIQAIGTHTVLVASTTIGESEAYEITKKLTEHIQDLLWDVPLNLARNTDSDPSKDLFYPIHDGARRFYSHNPPFFLDIAMLTGIGAYFSVIYGSYIMLLGFFRNYRIYRLLSTIDMIMARTLKSIDSTSDSMLSNAHIKKIRRISLRLMRLRKITYSEFSYIEDYINAYKL